MGGLTLERDDAGFSMTVVSPRLGASSTFSRLPEQEGITFCGDVDLVRALLALDFEWGLSSGLLGLAFSRLSADTGR